MIRIENLSMVFTTEDVQTRALNDVSLESHGSVGMWKIHPAEYFRNA